MRWRTTRVVDGTHLQMTLNKVHRAGATIAIGGLCGYGLEQTVDTTQGIRQVFPVIGSASATSLYYAGAQTASSAWTSNTSAFLNLNAQIASIARSGNVVTVTTTGNLPVDVNGLTMTISGVADSSYNGSFVVTTTGPTTLTYTNAGANSTSSGGTVGILTGGYVLYPMAEVLGVFDTATKSVDGQLTLAPNTVPWAANDPLEEPHYYQEKVSADGVFVSQIMPRPTQAQTAGLQYQSSVGPGLSGWTIANTVPASNYLGNGGTHSLPNAAYAATGIWKTTLDAQAGDQSVFAIHCNSHGCGKWNSIYNLFQLDSSVGADTITFQPTTSALTMNLRGTGYSFTPQQFTAPSVYANSFHLGASGGQYLAYNEDNVNCKFCNFYSSSSTQWGQGQIYYQMYFVGATGDPQDSIGFYVGSSPDSTHADNSVASLWKTGMIYKSGAVIGWGASATGSATAGTVPTYSAALSLGGTDTVSCGNGIAGDASCTFKAGSGVFSGNVTAANLRTELAGATASIGGSALTAGSCTNGNATVTGATVGSPVAVAAADGTLPGALVTLTAAVTASNTVTVQVCAMAAVTPVAKTYNVRVLQ